VSIIGSAFSGNKGAAAMLESAMESILAEFPDATFTLFSMYPREDSAQNRFSQVELIDARPRPLGVTINTLALLYKILPPLRPLLRSRSRAISALHRSDVLLDQMGISFTDGREKFLLYNAAAILPAFFLKVPVVKCAQAIGPFTNPTNRWVSKRFLPKAHTIVTRGRITHEFAVGLGLTNLVAGSDSAFALALTGAERESLAKSVDLSFFDSDDTVVGISPSVVVQAKYEAKTGGDYLALMADFANGLIADGYRVALVPHSVRTGTQKTQNNDLPLCVALHERIERPDRVLFADHELSSQDLRYLIGLCDFFVTSRFHAMVSSLAVGVPCLVIGWSHKYQEVLEMFELEEWAIGFDRLSPELLRSRADDLIANGPRVRASLTRHLPTVIGNTRQQERVILDLLRTPGKA
jgi:polysaccharide pyruvyl transferase WcaK-like protein